MSKFEKFVIALLIVIAVADCVVAVEVVRMERNGVSMEVTVEDIEAARAAFEEDLAEDKL